MLSSHLEKLVYFSAVVECGGFSAAARALRISQPALSRAIKAIEQDLGVALLRREQGRIGLTTAGDTLLSAASKVLKITKDVEVEIQELAGNRELALAMGTKEPFAIHLWPQYLSWLDASPANVSAQQAVANLSLSIDKSNRSLWNNLKAQKFDLLLVAEPPAEAGMQSTLLFTSEIRLYAGKKVPLHKPLFCYKDAVVKANKKLGAFLAPSRINRPVVDVQSFDAARELSIRGLGICLLPNWIASADIESRKLQELPLSTLGLSTALPKSKIFVCSVSHGRLDRKISVVTASLKIFCRERYS